MIKKALLVSLLATSALAAGALAGQIRVGQWWPVFLIPFAIIGTLLAWRVWHALPAATRKYIDEIEGKHGWAALPEAEVSEHS